MNINQLPNRSSKMESFSMRSVQGNYLCHVFVLCEFLEPNISDHVQELLYSSAGNHPEMILENDFSWQIPGHELFTPTYEHESLSDVCAKFHTSVRYKKAACFHHRYPD